MKRLSLILAMACCCAGMIWTARGQQWPPVNNRDDLWHFQHIDPDYDSTRHFRIGGMAALNIGASFKMNGNFNVSGNDPANGIYDDGYVRRDDTGDALGLTGYWGYQNSSQLSGNTLTMHSTTSFSAAGSADKNGGASPGFDLAYGDSYWYWGGAKVGWEFGFGLVPIGISDHQSLNNVTVTRAVYTFDTGGITVPEAPYNGGPSGVGEPLIYDTPTRGADDTSSGNTLAGTHSLDVMLYTVRLGPTFYWDFGRHFGLYAGGGPAVGLVSGELKYDETISFSGGGTAHNSGHVSGTQFTYGGYVNATVVYHAVDGGDFYLGAQYMPMGNTSISGGGREADLKLGGQVYITAGINWPF